MDKTKIVKKLKLKKFEKLFLEKKEQLLNPPVKETVMVDGGDEVDQVQTKVLNEMNERLQIREQGALRRVLDALERIQDGTFGICEECEEEIGEKRLIAIPYCNTCIRCAERQEKLSKQYRSI